MLSMIITFLLSKFDPPPPWQPMLSMIQVQVLHSFYQDLCIHFINISPPLGNPTHALNDNYIHFIKIWPPPLATHAFNDSGSSTTFLLSRFLLFLINISPSPLATQPMLSMITTFLLSKFRSPPWQPNPCFQWLLHSFYQNSPPPLATQPMLSMIITFLLSKFDPPPLGNPCFQWFRFKYYIPFINIFTFFLSKFPSPLATQPMLSMITTFILSKFDPPPLGNPLSMIQVQVLHSFYQDFYFF